MKNIFILVTLVLTASHCLAQTFSSSVDAALSELNSRIDQNVTTSLQDAPKARLPTGYSNSVSDEIDKNGYDTDSAYLNVFGGPVVGFRNGTMKPTAIAGVTAGQYFARTLGKGEKLSPQFGLGVIGPLTDGNPMDGMVFFDYMLANKLPAHHQYLSATVGYTRLFVTGDAVDFGCGFDFGRHEYDRILRVELRDYYLFDGPRQNILSLRMAFGKFISD